MKTHFTKLALAVVLTAGGTVAFAESSAVWPPAKLDANSQVSASAPKAAARTIDLAGAEIKEILGLRDGSSVYIFNDGKMAMETKFGQARRMDSGMVMETVEGRKIPMNGDEVARLDNLLYRAYGRGG